MPPEAFIVARDRSDLYRYLSQTFADAETVQVIWDRRNGDRRAAADRRQAAERAQSQATGERRRLAGNQAADRRHVERRARESAGVEHEMQSVGYAFLAIP